MAARRRRLQGALDRVLALDLRQVSFVFVRLVLFPDIRRGRVNGRAAHGEFEAGIVQPAVTQSPDS